MPHPPGSIIQFTQHPLKRAIYLTMLATTLAMIAIFTLFYLLPDAVKKPGFRFIQQTTANPPPTPDPNTITLTFARGMVLGFVPGFFIFTPWLIVLIISAKLLARRDLRKAAAIAEGDPARQAVIASMESRRRSMWFYVPARMYSGIDAKALLSALPQPRPLILSLGVHLPQDSATPPPPTAPGEEINLLELRQNPRRSKMLWLSAICITLMLGASIFFYVWLFRTAPTPGGGIPLGVFILIITPVFAPTLLILGAFFLTKVAPIRSAMLTPGRLEDYRFLRRFWPINRARHQAGLLTFTPQDSILVLTEPYRRRPVGTFIRHDGARVHYRLIADTKLDPLAEVLDRWQA
ncbi:MAG: hypothetical protein ACK5TP_02450 [bacterium]